MLHQEITEDPDVAQAIADLTPVVLEIRERTKALAEAKRLKPDQRAAAEAEIAELFSRLDLRAERLQIDVAALLTMINDAVGRARGATAIIAPTVTLADAVTAAIAREGRAHAALSAAQIEVRAATAARIDAEREYAKHAAGRAK